MKTWSNAWRRAGATVWIIALVAALAWAIWGYGERVGLVENHHKLFAFLLIIAIALVGYLAPRLLVHLKRQSHREQGQVDKVYPEADARLVQPPRPAFQLSELHDYLQERYGFFWRRKVRLLLVVGEPAQIEAIAPGLAKHQWLEGQDTVLLWGGSAQAKLDKSFEQWSGLTCWRALDGVVWALDKGQSADAALMGACVRHLQRLARSLRWQLPLYL